MLNFGDRRVMACTPADLKRWLGELCGCDPAISAGGSEAGAQLGAVGAASVEADTGVTLTLRWKVLEAHQIALLRVPQLELEFSYPGNSAALARAWIERFDRHTQRGGG
ncbi:MAG: hypothetical protein FJY25_08225 [Betaproteobacteria bacterium]|nr:hypothetical protein [Betaproteobacteria bacterium]